MMALISSGYGVARQSQTQKYWNASRAWHGFGVEGWNYERLINELASLKHLPTLVGFLASVQLEDVVNDNHTHMEEDASVVALPFGMQSSPYQAVAQTA
ncbi:hypothetical protein VJI72_07830 [Parvimonas micra]|nr:MULTISPECIES: hypothetical protein [Parvimonas]MEB3029690.1 hypothetical protein [Parvimonas micra]MEB3089944.1 hypothetical protein [Parvimonas sp. M20]